MKFLASDPTIDFTSLELRMTVMNELGEEVELVQGGRDIEVTSDNIDEYCMRVAKYHLITSVKDEMKEFLGGFFAVIPRQVIDVFDVDEMDFLLEGTQIIDLKDWKENTLYKGEFN